MDSATEEGSVRREPEFDIVGVGTAAVDDLLIVERYPGVDEKCQVLESRRSFGGLVGTALAAAAAAGARCAYAGVLTDDELGVAVRGALERAGVDCTRALLRGDGCTIHSTVVCERTRGTRTIYFSTPREYPRGAIDTPSIVDSARVLLVDQLGAEVAREARRLSVPVVADMEWPHRDDSEEFMAEVDHLIISRTFAVELTGETDPGAMVRHLHARHARACTAVTCGEEGCFYASGPSGALHHEPAVRVATLETNGCGDVFHGAYALALMRGWSVERCVGYASAAASAYAARPGGWEYLARDGEILELVGRRET
jgi:sugar/nucleoside kinase (ribokinase family)